MKAVFKMGLADTFRNAHNTAYARSRQIPSAEPSQATNANDALKELLLAHPYSTERSDEKWNQLVAALVGKGLARASTPAFRAAVNKVLNQLDA